MMSSCSSISLKSFFTRSSNSPRYFVPATNEAISKLIILLFFKANGTSLKAIICANCSTIAVFPTPASPIKIGLFFVLLAKISRILFNSFSLPITGSNSPCFAFFVKSVPNSSINNFSLDFLGLAILYINSLYNSSKSIFIPSIIRIAIPSPSSNKEENKFSIVTSLLWLSLLSKIALSSILFNKGVYRNKLFSSLPTPTILTNSFLKVS